MKTLLKRIINSTGFEIKRHSRNNLSLQQRPVGDMQCFLEDLKSRGLRCSFIIDVGANRTDWSRMAKKIFIEADFCLIEPQVEMEKSLHQFCNEFTGSFFIEAGAGACKEFKTLTVWDDLLGSSFLPASSEELKQSNQQRTIEIITIDEIIFQHKKQMPELIKLDIQGFELEALRGAESTFGNTEAYILEISFFDFDNMGMPVFADVVNFMLERNYVVYDFPGFLRRPFDNALGQCDVCFVKKDGFLHTSNKWN